jgi:hypothetical protein
MNILRLGDRDVPWILIRKNIRHLYARVKPEGYVQITGPRNTTIAVAEAFLRGIEKRLLPHLDSLPVAPWTSGDPVSVWGLSIPCKVESGRSRAEIIEGILHLPASDSGKPDSEALERFYGDLLLQEIPILCAKWNLSSAEENGPKVRFKTQRMSSRLGSCQTVRRIIKLNTVLGRFDRRYLEAVFLHEWCHLRVPDHGPRFYRLLESFVPDYRSLRKELTALVRTIGR